ncbi:hypothetical protein [Rhodococcus sp. NPDC049939]|uniref:hypothetical protein n=1 Tax=Rhodococcus sp. NPDC049939 TaxID=3155511 RepID=UPI0033DD0EF3
MNRQRMNQRDRDHFKQLHEMAAPGYAPWPLAEPSCPTGKLRWATEHAAASALLDARQSRLRRAKGEHLGKLETRMYTCTECNGFHLTAMSAEEYVSRRR